MRNLSCVLHNTFFTQGACRVDFEPIAKAVRVKRVSAVHSKNEVRAHCLQADAAGEGWGLRKFDAAVQNGLLRAVRKGSPGFQHCLLNLFFFFN